MLTSCMPALICPPVSHSNCLPACSSRQPRGMATGMRLPSRSHTKSPGKRDLPWIVRQFRSCAALQAFSCVGQRGQALLCSACQAHNLVTGLPE